MKTLIIEEHYGQQDGFWVVTKPTIPPSEPTAVSGGSFRFLDIVIRGCDQGKLSVQGDPALALMVERRRFTR